MVAVDAMGGDFAPQEAVKGAIAAAKNGIPLVLFGNQDKVMSLLTDYCPRWRSLPIELVHCDDVIEMDDDPVKGVLRKKESSIMRGLQSLKVGKTHAFISAGNSGAIMAAAAIVVGRVAGVMRPAIGSFLPTDEGSFFCLDLGANPDCKPEHLVQFAYMGHAYVRLTQQIAQPKIGLLSNGHESYKGSSLVRDTFALLEKTSLHFIGNIEARDIFSGHADIVVTDGFTGNVLLKGIQGTVQAVMGWMKSESVRSWWSKLLLLCARPVLTRIKKQLDYARTGGALLLGVEKPVIIAHGSSNAQAITQAIIFAHTTARNKIVSKFNESLRTLLKSSDVSRAHKHRVLKEKQVQL